MIASIYQKRFFVIPHKYAQLWTRRRKKEALQRDTNYQVFKIKCLSTWNLSRSKFGRETHPKFYSFSIFLPCWRKLFFTIKTMHFWYTHWVTQPCFWTIRFKRFVHSHMQRRGFNIKSQFITKVCRVSRLYRLSHSLQSYQIYTVWAWSTTLLLNLYSQKLLTKQI